MRDLKAIGAHNVTAGRARGLTGKRTLSSMVSAYETNRRADGKLPATYEVVFGHAWAPARPAHGRTRDDGEVRVPVGSIGRRGGAGRQS
jgi:malonyl-CoA O-methyltransferase